jgi:bacterioferritin-associated ferredoxin
MYVCLCNAVTDGQVRAVACGQDCSVAGLYRLLGVQPKCGKCVPTVRDILGETANTNLIPAGAFA